MFAVAIPCAVLSAFFLAFGAYFQGSSIKANHSGSDVSFHAIFSMFKNRRWLSGLGCMGAGILLNIIALSLAPLMVVQPIGALSLVITTLIHARAIGASLNSLSIAAITACVVGSAVFVACALQATGEHEISPEEENHTLIALGVVTAIIAIAMLGFKKFLKPFTYVVAAGMLFGFVAVLMRITLTQVFNSNGLFLENVNPLGVACLVITGGFGAWIVQNAYAKVPPDIVIAGLTVLDPIVGILIGIIILGEAKADITIVIASGMILSACVAIAGVIGLAKYHPEKEVEANKVEENI